MKFTMATREGLAATTIRDGLEAIARRPVMKSGEHVFCRYAGDAAMKDDMARHIIGLVIEEAEVLHARVMTAFALANEAAVGSNAGGAADGAGGGSAEVASAGSSTGTAVGSGDGASEAGSSSAQPQYVRVAPFAVQVLTDWQCVSFPF